MAPAGARIIFVPTNPDLAHILGRTEAGIHYIQPKFTQAAKVMQNHGVTNLATATAGILQPLLIPTVAPWVPG